MTLSLESMFNDINDAVVLVTPPHFEERYEEWYNPGICHYDVIFKVRDN